MIEGFKPLPFNEASIIPVMEAKRKKKPQQQRGILLPKPVIKTEGVTPIPNRGWHREHRFIYGKKRSQRHDPDF